MRRVVSILFLFLMLLQAIPVLHFFSSQKEVFYTYIDEEKTEGAKEKKDGKEYLSLNIENIFSQPAETVYAVAANVPYFPPVLGFFTPPPDRC